MPYNLKPGTKEIDSIGTFNKKSTDTIQKLSENFSKKITKKPAKKSPSFIDSVKSYFKGEQGLIPDFKNKPTKQAMNESTFFNPITGSERMSNRMDSAMHAGLLEKQNKGQKLGPGEQRSLGYYNAKDKKTRPNRKDRY
jgi:hypothetical protein